MMSFSAEVKEELAKKRETARHCQIAEFAAIMAFCGKIRRKSGGQMQIAFVTENELVFETYTGLLQDIFEMNETDYVVAYEGKNNHLIQVFIEDSAYVAKILMTLKWCDEEFLRVEPVFVNQMLVQKDCCKKAFLRGSFLAAGSISDPNKFYHYEIVCEYEEDADSLRDMLVFFSLDAKVIMRKQSYIVYLKEGSNITDALNLMGAVVSQMNLFNIMILKDMRNDVNRKVNCETANLNKTIEAAVKQIRDIEYIRDTVGLESLSENLRQTALIRLENPDMNLKDIGELLTPVVGKSGVNHRLRKISEMAERLRGDTEEEN